MTGWVDVNTSEDTWKVKDEVLICSGKPIGVMRIYLLKTPDEEIKNIFLA